MFPLHLFLLSHAFSHHLYESILEICFPTGSYLQNYSPLFPKVQTFSPTCPMDFSSMTSLFLLLPLLCVAQLASHSQYHPQPRSTFLPHPCLICCHCVFRISGISIPTTSLPPWWGFHAGLPASQNLLTSLPSSSCCCKIQLPEPCFPSCVFSAQKSHSGSQLSIVSGYVANHLKT